jgi:putative flippase GtrA
MNKLWQFVRTKFLTKKFLTFGIIGVANTLIHMTTYFLSYNTFEQASLGDTANAALSNTLAFVTASIFSYFANAVFTFKPVRKNSLQFLAVMAVFLARWGISTLLTMGFDWMVRDWIGIDYSVSAWAKLIAPFLASALLIPIAYFALGWVFQKTDKTIPNKSASDS